METMECLGSFVVLIEREVWHSYLIGCTHPPYICYTLCYCASGVMEEIKVLMAQLIVIILDWISSWLSREFTQ
uniref:Uncharacterized protein n=1 Tax=Rhizophora mucronata TaxID=61149 RepID=A0A2P2IWD2_RHIMU